MKRRILMSENQFRHLVNYITETENLPAATGGQAQQQGGNQQQGSGGGEPQSQPEPEQNNQQNQQQNSKLKEMLMNDVSEIETIINECIGLCQQIGRMQQETVRPMNEDTNGGQSSNGRQGAENEWAKAFGDFMNYRNSARTPRGRINMIGAEIKKDLGEIIKMYKQMNAQISTTATAYATSGFGGALKQAFLNNTSIGRAITGARDYVDRVNLREGFVGDLFHGVVSGMAGKNACVDRNMGKNLEAIKQQIKKIWYGPLTKCYQCAMSNRWINLYQFLAQLREANYALYDELEKE